MATQDSDFDDFDRKYKPKQNNQRNEPSAENNQRDEPTVENNQNNEPLDDFDTHVYRF